MKTLIALLIAILGIVHHSKGQDFEIPADADFTYDAPKSYVYTIPASQFLSDDDSSQYLSCDIISCKFKYFKSGPSASSAYATAPVYLPDEADVSLFTIWVYDEDNGEQVTCSLMKYALEGSPGPSSLAVIGTSAADMSTEIIEKTHHNVIDGIIDNRQYGYYIQYEASDADSEDLRIFGVRLTYTITKVD